MIETLERFLQAEWENFCPHHRPPRHVRAALLSSSRDRDGTRVVLVFGDGRPHPALVAKIPRQPTGAARLEREWRLLQHVWQSLPQKARRGVPEPLCMTTVRGMPVFVQRALRGYNLKTLIQRGIRAFVPGRMAADLMHMSRWLARFQNARPPDSSPPGLSIPRHPPLVTRMAQAKARLVDTGMITRFQFERLVDQASDLDALSQTSPSCWVHGDLWPGNVLEDRGRWGIIDWDGVSIGPGWYDRLWFALHLAAMYRSRRSGEPDLRRCLNQVFSSRTGAESLHRFLSAPVVPARPAGPSYRVALTVLLAVLAAEVAAGRPTRQILPLEAPNLLQLSLRSGSDH